MFSKNIFFKAICIILAIAFLANEVSFAAEEARSCLAAPLRSASISGNILQSESPVMFLLDTVAQSMIEGLTERQARDLIRETVIQRYPDDKNIRTFDWRNLSEEERPTGKVLILPFVKGGSFVFTREQYDSKIHRLKLDFPEGTVTVRAEGITPSDRVGHTGSSSQPTDAVISLQPPAIEAPQIETPQDVETPQAEEAKPKQAKFEIISERLKRLLGWLRALRQSPAYNRSVLIGGVVIACLTGAPMLLGMPCDRMYYYRELEERMRREQLRTDRDIEEKVKEAEGNLQEMGEFLDDLSDTIADESREDFETEVTDTEKHDIREVTIKSVARYVKSGKKDKNFEEMVSILAKELQSKVFTRDSVDKVEAMLKAEGVSGGLKKIYDKAGETLPIIQGSPGSGGEEGSKLTDMQKALLHNLQHMADKLGILKHHHHILLFAITAGLGAYAVSKYIFGFDCDPIFFGALAMSVGFGAPQMPGQEEDPAEIIKKYTNDLDELANDRKIDDTFYLSSSIAMLNDQVANEACKNAFIVGDPVATQGMIEATIVRKQSLTNLKNAKFLEVNTARFIDSLAIPGQLESDLRKLTNAIKTLYKDERIILVLNFQDFFDMYKMKGGMGASLYFQMIEAIEAKNISVVILTNPELYERKLLKEKKLQDKFGVIDLKTLPEYDLKRIARNHVRRLNIIYKDILPDGVDIKISREDMEMALYLAQKYYPQGLPVNKFQEVLDRVITGVFTAGDRLSAEVSETRKKLLKSAQELHSAIARSAPAEEIEFLEVTIDRLMTEREAAAKKIEENEKLLEKIKKEKRWDISLEDAAKQIAEDRGIPLRDILAKEDDLLKEYVPRLKEMLIGQDTVIDETYKAFMRRVSIGEDKNRPIGAYMLVGPTGVGKTEFARSLARHMFGAEDAMIRIDMSEYMNPIDAQKLIGSPPGYVGYEQGGILTEHVSRKPYSVVLLDEIEKANPAVFKLLLQVFEEGELRDGKGRIANFKNTIIIMTSNIGFSEQFKSEKEDAARLDEAIKYVGEEIRLCNATIADPAWNKLVSAIKKSFEELKANLARHGMKDDELEADLKEMSWILSDNPQDRAMLTDRQPFIVQYLTRIKKALEVSRKMNNTQAAYDYIAGVKYLADDPAEEKKAAKEVEKILRAGRDIYRSMIQSFIQQDIVVTQDVFDAYAKINEILTIKSPREKVEAYMKYLRSNIRNKIMESVKAIFSPELLNRIGLDNIISFDPLSKEDLEKILDIKLRGIDALLKEEGFGFLTLDQALRDKVLEEGYDIPNGARPVERALRRLVLAPLSDKILERALERGKTVEASLVDGKIAFTQKEMEKKENAMAHGEVIKGIKAESGPDETKLAEIMGISPTVAESGTLQPEAPEELCKKYEIDIEEQDDIPLVYETDPAKIDAELAKITQKDNILKNTIDQLEPLMRAARNDQQRQAIANQLSEAKEVQDKLKAAKEILTARKAGNTQRAADLQKAFEDNMKKEEADARKALNNSFENLSIEALRGELEDFHPSFEGVSRIAEALKQKRRNYPLILDDSLLMQKSVVDSFVKNISDGTLKGFDNTRVLRLKLESLKDYFSLVGFFESRMKEIIEAIEEDDARKSIKTVIVIDFDDIKNELERVRINPFMLGYFLRMFKGLKTISFVMTTSRESILNDDSFDHFFSLVDIPDADKKDILENLYLFLKDHILKKSNANNGTKYDISFDAMNMAVKVWSQYPMGRDPIETIRKWFIGLVNKKKQEDAQVGMGLRDALSDLKEELTDLAQTGHIEEDDLGREQVVTEKIRQANEYKEMSKREKTLVISPDDLLDYVVRTEAAQSGAEIDKEFFTKDENSTLINIEEALGARVLNQSEAITAASRVLKIAQAGLKNKKAPIGTFIFAGPTGVGKTQLAKTIAKERGMSLLRIDMTEYRNSEDLSRLIGATSGYVGYMDDMGEVDEGILFKHMRDNPKTVLLFDEVEKADPMVLNILLQIMEDGRFTSNLGNTVRFDKSIIILTTNLGMETYKIDENNRVVKESLYPEMERVMRDKGPDRDRKISEFKKKIDESVQASAKKFFRPEFLNRIDQIVVFNPLPIESLTDIVAIFLKETAESFKNKQGFNLVIGRNAEERAAIYKYLADKGYQPENGARPMEQAVKKYFENELVEYLLHNRTKLSKGDTITAIFDKGRIWFESSKTQAQVSSMPEEDRKVLKAIAARLKDRPAEPITTEELEEIFGLRTEVAMGMGEKLEMAGSSVELKNTDFLKKDAGLAFLKDKAWMLALYPNGVSGTGPTLVKNWIRDAVRLSKMANLEALVYEKEKRVIEGFYGMRRDDLENQAASYIGKAGDAKETKLVWEVKDGMVNVGVVYNSRLTRFLYRTIFARSYKDDNDIGQNAPRSLQGLLKAKLALEKLGGKMSFYSEQDKTTLWMTIPIEVKPQAPPQKTYTREEIDALKSQLIKRDGSGEIMYDVIDEDVLLKFTGIAQYETDDNVLDFLLSLANQYAGKVAADSVLLEAEQVVVQASSAPSPAYFYTTAHKQVLNYLSMALCSLAYTGLKTKALSVLEELASDENETIRQIAQNNIKNYKQMLLKNAQTSTAKPATSVRDIMDALGYKDYPLGTYKVYEAEPIEKNGSYTTIKEEAMFLNNAFQYNVVYTHKSQTLPSALTQIGFAYTPSPSQNKIQFYGVGGVKGEYAGPDLVFQIDNSGDLPRFLIPAHIYANLVGQGAEEILKATHVEAMAPQPQPVVAAAADIALDIAKSLGLPGYGGPYELRGDSNDIPPDCKSKRHFSVDISQNRANIYYTEELIRLAGEGAELVKESKWKLSCKLDLNELECEWSTRVPAGSRDSGGFRIFQAKAPLLQQMSFQTSFYKIGSAPQYQSIDIKVTPEIYEFFRSQPGGEDLVAKLNMIPGYVPPEPAPTEQTRSQRTINEMADDIALRYGVTEKKKDSFTFVYKPASDADLENNGYSLEKGWVKYNKDQIEIHLQVRYKDLEDGKPGVDTDIIRYNKSKGTLAWIARGVTQQKGSCKFFDVEAVGQKDMRLRITLSKEDYDSVPQYLKETGVFEVVALDEPALAPTSEPAAAGKQLSEEEIKVAAEELVEKFVVVFKSHVNAILSPYNNILEEEYESNKRNLERLIKDAVPNVLEEFLRRIKEPPSGIIGDTGRYYYPDSRYWSRYIRREISVRVKSAPAIEPAPEPLPVPLTSFGYRAGASLGFGASAAAAQPLVKGPVNKGTWIEVTIPELSEELLMQAIGIGGREIKDSVRKDEDLPISEFFKQNPETFKDIIRHLNERQVPGSGERIVRTVSLEIGSDQNRNKCNMTVDIGWGVGGDSIKFEIKGYEEVSYLTLGTPIIGFSSTLNCSEIRIKIDPSQFEGQAVPASYTREEINALKSQLIKKEGASEIEVIDRDVLKKLTSIAQTETDDYVLNFFISLTSRYAGLIAANSMLPEGVQMRIGGINVNELLIKAKESILDALSAALYALGYLTGKKKASDAFKALANHKNESIRKIAQDVQQRYRNCKKPAAAAPREESKEPTKPHIRWMIRRDMPEVLDIEKKSFEDSWDEDDFMEDLRQRCVIGMVAEHDEKIVGFMIYELNKTDIHILNFAVHPDHRFRGIGNAMAQKLKSKLGPRRDKIFLEVRKSGRDTQLFFKKIGFQAARMLSAFYKDTDEDAILMEYKYKPDEGSNTLTQEGAPVQNPNEVSGSGRKQPTPDEIAKNCGYANANADIWVLYEKDELGKGEEEHILFGTIQNKNIGVYKIKRPDDGQPLYRFVYDPLKKQLFYYEPNSNFDYRIPAECSYFNIKKIDKTHAIVEINGKAYDELKDRGAKFVFKNISFESVPGPLASSSDPAAVGRQGIPTKDEIAGLYASFLQRVAQEEPNVEPALRKIEELSPYFVQSLFYAILYGNAEQREGRIDASKSGNLKSGDIVCWFALDQDGKSVYKFGRVDAISALAIKVTEFLLIDAALKTAATLNDRPATWNYFGNTITRVLTVNQALGLMLPESVRGAMNTLREQFVYDLTPVKQAGPSSEPAAVELVQIARELKEAMEVRDEDAVKAIASKIKQLPYGSEVENWQKLFDVAGRKTKIEDIAPGSLFYFFSGKKWELPRKKDHVFCYQRTDDTTTEHFDINDGNVDWQERPGTIVVPLNRYTQVGDIYVLDPDATAPAADEDVIKSLCDVIKPGIDEKVLKAVIETLGILGKNNRGAAIYVSSVATGMGYGDDVRESAIRELVKIAVGNEDAIRSLTLIVGNESSPDVDNQVIETLGKIGIGNKAAIEKLSKIVDGAIQVTPGGYLIAIRALGNIASESDENAGAALTTVARSSKPASERIAAAESLDKMNPGNIVAKTVLKIFAEDRSNEAVRMQAKLALARVILRNQDDIAEADPESLLAIFADESENPVVRNRARQILRSQVFALSEPALRMLLSEMDSGKTPEIRIAAARFLALLQRNKEKAIKNLIGFGLEGPGADAPIKFKAIETLSDLSDEISVLLEPVAAAAISNFKEWGRERREAVITLLEKLIGDKTVSSDKLKALEVFVKNGTAQNSFEDTTYASRLLWILAENDPLRTVCRVAIAGNFAKLTITLRRLLERPEDMSIAAFNELKELLGCLISLKGLRSLVRQFLEEIFVKMRQGAAGNKLAELKAALVASALIQVAPDSKDAAGFLIEYLKTDIKDKDIAEAIKLECIEGLAKAAKSMRRPSEAPEARVQQPVAAPIGRKQPTIEEMMKNCSRDKYDDWTVLMKSAEETGDLQYEEIIDFTDKAIAVFQYRSSDSGAGWPYQLVYKPADKKLEYVRTDSRANNIPYTNDNLYFNIIKIDATHAVIEINESAYRELEEKGAKLTFENISIVIVPDTPDEEWDTFVVPAQTGSLDKPRGVAVDAAGNIFVACEGNDTVVVFNPDGRSLNRKFGVNGVITKEIGGFDKPQHLTFNASGTLLVTNKGNNTVSAIQMINNYTERDPNVGDNGIITSAMHKCAEIAGIAKDKYSNILLANYEGFIKGGETSIEVNIRCMIPSGKEYNLNFGNKGVISASLNIELGPIVRFFTDEDDNIHLRLKTRKNIKYVGLKPFGKEMDLNSKDLLVVDGDNSSIYKERWGAITILNSSVLISREAGCLSEPQAVCVGKDGAFIVTNGGNNSLSVIRQRPETRPEDQPMTPEEEKAKSYYALFVKSLDGARIGDNTWGSRIREACEWAKNNQPAFRRSILYAFAFGNAVQRGQRLTEKPASSDITANNRVICFCEGGKDIADAKFYRFGTVFNYDNEIVNVREFLRIDARTGEATIVDKVLWGWLYSSGKLVYFPKSDLEAPEAEISKQFIYDLLPRNAGTAVSDAPANPLTRIPNPDPEPLPVPLTSFGYRAGASLGFRAGYIETYYTPTANGIWQAVIKPYTGTPSSTTTTTLTTLEGKILFSIDEKNCCIKATKPSGEPNEDFGVGGIIPQRVGKFANKMSLLGPGATSDSLAVLNANGTYLSIVSRSDDTRRPEPQAPKGPDKPDGQNPPKGTPSLVSDIVDNLISVVGNAMTSWEVRTAAVNAIGDIGAGNQKAIDRMLTIGIGWPSEIREAATGVLRKIAVGNRTAIDKIIERYKKADGIDKYEDMMTLSEIARSDEKAVKFLLETIDGYRKPGSASPMVFEALKKTAPKDDKDVIAILEKFIKDKKISLNVRIKAAEILGTVNTGNEAAATLLTGATNSKSIADAEKLEAALTLGEINPSNPEVVGKLISIATGFSIDSRTDDIASNYMITAIDMIGEVGNGNEDAINYLTMILDDTETTRDSTRLVAAKALARIVPGSEKARLELMPFANIWYKGKPNNEFDYSALDTLFKYYPGYKDTVTALDYFVRNTNAPIEQRKECLRRLTYFGQGSLPNDDYPEINTLLIDSIMNTNETPEWRAFAAECYYKRNVGEKQIIEPISKLYDEIKEQIQQLVRNKNVQGDDVGAGSEKGVMLIKALESLSVIYGKRAEYDMFVDLGFRTLKDIVKEERFKTSSPGALTLHHRMLLQLAETMLKLSIGSKEEAFDVIDGTVASATSTTQDPSVTIAAIEALGRVGAIIAKNTAATKAGQVEVADNAANEPANSALDVLFERALKGDKDAIEMISPFIKNLPRGYTTQKVLKVLRESLLTKNAERFDSARRLIREIYLCVSDFIESSCTRVDVASESASPVLKKDDIVCWFEWDSSSKVKCLFGRFIEFKNNEWVVSRIATMSNTDNVSSIESPAVISTSLPMHLIASADEVATDDLDALFERALAGDETAITTFISKADIFVRRAKLSRSLRKAIIMKDAVKFENSVKIIEKIGYARLWDFLEADFTKIKLTSDRQGVLGLLDLKKGDIICKVARTESGPQYLFSEFDTYRTDNAYSTNQFGKRLPNTSGFNFYSPPDNIIAIMEPSNIIYLIARAADAVAMQAKSEPPQAPKTAKKAKSAKKQAPEKPDDGGQLGPSVQRYSGGHEMIRTEKDEAARAAKLTVKTKKTFKEARPELLKELGKACDDFKADKPQSLILYADDILKNAILYDFEDTLKLLKEKNVLAGGKIVLYVRDKEMEQKTEGLKALIENNLRSSTEVVVIKQWERGQLISPGDPVKEIESLVRISASRGAKEILGVIRGNSLDWAETFRDYNLEIPLVVINNNAADKNISGLFSFTQAILLAMKTKAALKDMPGHAFSAWIRCLDPIEKLTVKLYQDYIRYRDEILTKA